MSGKREICKADSCSHISTSRRRTRSSRRFQICIPSCTQLKGSAPTLDLPIDLPILTVQIAGPLAQPLPCNVWGPLSAHCSLSLSLSLPRWLFCSDVAISPVAWFSFARHGREILQTSECTQYECRRKVRLDGVQRELP